MRKRNKWVLTYAATSMAVLSLATANQVSAAEDSKPAPQTESQSATDSKLQQPAQPQQQTSGNTTSAGPIQPASPAGQDTSKVAPVNPQTPQTYSAPAPVSYSQAPVVNTPTTPAPTANAATPTTGESSATIKNVVTGDDAGTIDDDLPDAQENVLGYGAYFHILANHATLNAHTNGNLAVGTLDGKVNFGTNIKDGELDTDLSYIQNFENMANSSFVYTDQAGRKNKVIFGSGIAVDTTNPNRPMVNGVDLSDGTNLDHLTADEVFQDKDGQVYLDIANYLANQSSETSKNLATADPTHTLKNSDFPDQNTRTVDLSQIQPNEHNQIIINVDPDVLTANTPLYIKGLSGTTEGTMVIFNVDTNGQDPYTVNTPIKVYYKDGEGRNPEWTTDEERPNQETEFFDDNHLLWNFYDSTQADQLNQGTIKINAPFQGSVLAPKGTFEVNQNLDGNIVADKVVVNAETHRWDLQDNSKEPTYTFVPLPGIVPDWLPEEPDPEPEPGDEGEGEPGNTTDPEPGDEGEGEPGNTTDPEPGDEGEGEPGNTTDPEPGDEGEGEPGNTTDPEPGDEGEGEPGNTTDPAPDNEGEGTGNMTVPDEDATEEGLLEEEQNLSTTEKPGNAQNESSIINGSTNELLASGENTWTTNATVAKEHHLPQTGEKNSLVYTLAGFALIGIGAVLGFRRRKA